MEQNKMCHSKMKFTCIKQATFEAQFLKKLSNNEVELKKSVAYKKRVVQKTSSLTLTTYLTKMNTMTWSYCILTGPVCRTWNFTGL